MATFRIDLQFHLHLQRGDYPMNLEGFDLPIHHEVIEQGRLDPRLGGYKGRFGFEKPDSLGLLRYSRLEFAIEQNRIEELETALFGEKAQIMDFDGHERRAQLALRICNAFLDKLRAVGKFYFVHPLGRNDLSFLHYESEREHADIRLYGGGFGAVPIGLAAPTLEKFRTFLQSPDPAPAYELALLDAARLAESGSGREAVIVCIGALESALDAFLLRRWRGSTPKPNASAAARELGHRGDRGIVTLDDVVKAVGVGKKVKWFCDTFSVSVERRERLLYSIDIRNFAVHGGVEIPVDSAKQNVWHVSDFIEGPFNGELAALPVSPNHARILENYGEATAQEPPQGLVEIANDYLTRFKLDAVMLDGNQREHGGGVADHLGSLLIFRVPLASLAPPTLALTLARAIVHFSLRRQHRLAYLVAGRGLPDDFRRVWQQLAGDLTRAVWGPAIDKMLSTHGFESEISIELGSQVDKLKAYYGTEYAPPESHEYRYLAEYAQLVPVLEALDPDRRTDLVEVIQNVNAPLPFLALQPIDAVSKARLEDPTSIQEALIAVHDAHLGILASAIVYDPVSRGRYGRGLTLDSLWR